MEEFVMDMVITSVSPLSVKKDDLEFRPCILVVLL